MAVEIRALSDDLEGDVAAFNARIAAAGVSYRLPTRPDQLFGRVGGGPVTQDMFVALVDGVVRGGYLLKDQSFLLDNAIVEIGNYELPLSEGIVEPAYAAIGATMLLDALHRRPLLYALGIGSTDEQLARMLSAARWQLIKVPFFFSMMRAGVLNEMPFVRRHWITRSGVRLLFMSGAAALTAAVHRRSASQERDTVVRIVDHFGDEAEAVWHASKAHYRLAAERTQSVLNQLYSQGDPRFRRIVVEEAGRTVGWAVVLASSLNSHNYFGSLTLGTVVDAFGRPADAPRILAAALSTLRVAGCDLIITNQCHGAWVRAARRRRMIQGPSNYILAVSPHLARRLNGFQKHKRLMHFTRGDGDGPINL